MENFRYQKLMSDFRRKLRKKEANPMRIFINFSPRFGISVLFYSRHIDPPLLPPSGTKPHWAPPTRRPVPRRILPSGDRLRSGSIHRSPRRRFPAGCQKMEILGALSQRTALMVLRNKPVRRSDPVSGRMTVILSYTDHSDEVVWASNTQAIQEPIWPSRMTGT